MSGVYTSLAAPPEPATGAPPGVADAGAVGAMPRYAREDHTHAGKARKAIVTTAADGTYTWTYPVPFGAGVVPIISGTAVTAAGVSDLVNVQIEGTPTNTQAKIRVTRAGVTVAALLGLTILSIPASPGATVVHLLALEP